MATEDRSSAMERSMKVNGSTVIWRAKDFYSEKMALHTQENGSTICNMATDTKSGQMVPNMKAISQKERSKATAS